MEKRQRESKKNEPRTDDAAQARVVAARPNNNIYIRDINIQQQSLSTRGRSDIPSDGFTLDSRYHPHFVGGISLIQTARFNPYPAFPPYDVRTLHPGLRPTSAT